MRVPPTTSISGSVLALLTWGSAAITVVLIAGLAWLAHPEVVPLTIVTAAVLVWPITRDRAHGRIDLSEPYTLVVVTVAFWHFVAGTAAYAFGRQDRVFYLERLRGQPGTVVVTQVLILVGLVALGLAARSSLAVRVAARIEPSIPRGVNRARDLEVLTWTLLAVGLGASIVGALQGTVGYVAVTNDGIGTVAGFGGMMAAMSTIPLVEAHVAGATRRATISMAVAVLLTMVAQSVIAGNRGTALAYIFVALFATSRLPRRFGTRRVVAVSAAAFLVVTIAVAFGSAYRAVSTEPDGTVTGSIVENAPDALADLWHRGPGVVVYVTDRVTERLDSTISASVVVAQYDDLGDEERAADIDNDIVRSAVAALVPRVIWPDKPSFDPQTLGVVYFGFPNAYATTPVATLLRNFGPLSVAIGMALVGLILGAAHKTLAAADTWTGARAVVYISVTRATNMEGSLASFLPDASRLVIVSLAAIALAWGISRAIDAVRGRPAGSAASVPERIPTAGTTERDGQTANPAPSDRQLIGWLVALTCVAWLASSFV